MFFDKLVNSGELTPSKRIYTIIGFFYAALILVVQEWTKVEINSVVFAFLLAIPLFTIPFTTYMSYVFFTIPLCYGVHGIYCFFLLISLVIRKGYCSLAQCIIPFAFLFIEYLDIILYPAANFNFFSIFFYLVFLSVFFYSIFYDSNSEEYRRLIISFCIGTLFSLLLLYGRMLIISSFQDLLLISSRADYDTGEVLLATGNHFILNANSIAYFSISVLSILVCCKRWLELNTIVYYLLLLIAVTFGLLTYSRTWVLCFALLIVLFFLTSKAKEKKSLVFFMIIFILCIFLINGEIVDTLFLGFQSRFIDDNVSSAGGRLELYKYFNHFFFSNSQYWLTGTGTLNYKAICLTEKSIHNGLQQIYVCTGFIGVFLFYLTYKLLRNRLSNRPRAVLFVPLIIILLFDQSIQSIYPYALLFPFILGVFALQLDTKDE